MNESLGTDTTKEQIKNRLRVSVRPAATGDTHFCRGNCILQCSLLLHSFPLFTHIESFIRTPWRHPNMSSDVEKFSRMPDGDVQKWMHLIPHPDQCIKEGRFDKVMKTSFGISYKKISEVTIGWNSVTVSSIFIISCDDNSQHFGQKTGYKPIRYLYEPPNMKNKFHSLSYVVNGDTNFCTLQRHLGCIFKLVKMKSRKSVFLTTLCKMQYAL